MQVPTEGKRKRNANNSLSPHMHCNIIIDHYIMNSRAERALAVKLFMHVRNMPVSRSYP